MVEPATKTPLIQRLTSALHQGQSIEWDEEVIDSAVLPASFADSSAFIKTITTNYQRGTYHVKVTIPDSTVHKFQLDRTVTHYPAVDTMAPPQGMVSRTVTYGKQVKTYDFNGTLTSTITTTDGDSAVDFADLPFFEYRPDTVLTDSGRSALVSQMTGAGQTVTSLGSSGYLATYSITGDGATWNLAALFDHDHMAMTRCVVTNGADTSLNESYTYSSVGGFLINTARLSKSHSAIESAAFAGIQSIESDINPARKSADYVKILNLSNISLP
jgi:hypothetical protein